MPVVSTRRGGTGERGGKTGTEGEAEKEAEAEAEMADEEDAAKGDGEEGESGG